MVEEVKTVVILAGGKGTRMREETEFIPKPMVKIGGTPILEHLINYFNHFEHFNFIICTGYKEEVIFDYFNKKKMKNVQILSTGNETNTGGRIAMVEEHIDNNFIMTYGDGLSDININKLINFHFSHNKTATISVNKPTSRFGLVDFKENGEVIAFTEKPILDSYVNMGYMIFSKEIFKFIDGDEIFEKEPLKRLANNHEIYAFKHGGFFRPMDTYRELLELNEMWNNNDAPWKI